MNVSAWVDFYLKTFFFFFAVIGNVHLRSHRITLLQQCILLRIISPPGMMLMFRPLRHCVFLQKVHGRKSNCCSIKSISLLQIGQAEWIWIWLESKHLGKLSQCTFGCLHTKERPQGSCVKNHIIVATVKVLPVNREMVWLGFDNQTGYRPSWRSNSWNVSSERGIDEVSGTPMSISLSCFLAGVVSFVG